MTCDGKELRAYGHIVDDVFDYTARANHFGDKTQLVLEKIHSNEMNVLLEFAYTRTLKDKDLWKNPLDLYVAAEYLQVPNTFTSTFYTSHNNVYRSAM
jgi:hypothetical protein